MALERTILSFMFPFMLFCQAMADVVKAHLESGISCSRQLPLRCPMCVNPTCGLAKDFFLNQTI